MIHLMLNDLSCPAGKVFSACLHLQGLILYLDGLISLTLTWATEKRQTTFLSIIGAVFLNDFGIEHHCVCRGSSDLLEKGDDALAHADHIRHRADTTFLVRHQRIKQVLQISPILRAVTHKLSI